MQRWLQPLILLGLMLAFDQRAGLLVGQGGEPPRKPVSYSFPHRSFQE